MADDAPKPEELAAVYAADNKCDVLLFSGPLDPDSAPKLYEVISARTKRADTLVVILATFGGDAHVTYRVGRLLQRNYDHVKIVINGWCKSAGTLLAVSGHELVIGDLGELGPIDVQRLRPDDLWERSSGLTEEAAIAELAEISWKLFRTLSLKTKQLSVGHTFKTAAEVTAPLVSQMLAPIFAQMDPHHIGENARAVKIARDYGIRLNVAAGNLAEEGMDMLVTGYSSHEFVITREEASILFNKVSGPDEGLRALCASLERVATVPSEPLEVRYLNQEEDNESNHSEEAKHDGTRKGGKRRAAKPAANPEPAA